MKPNIRAGALAVCAIALCSFPHDANAVPVNVTINTDNTAFVPVDIAPPAPIASPFTFGTTFTGVTGTNGIRRSPFEGNVQFATAAYSAVEGPPPVGGASAAYSVLNSTLFQIFWGSVDKYNTLAFYNGNTFVGSLTGGDLAPLVFGFGHDFVELTVGGVFNTVVMTSSINAFEFSNIVASCPEGRSCEPPAAVPLPAALPLFASGIVGLGGLFGWRKKRKSAAKDLTA